MKGSIQDALLSLEGLSVGDGFGERFFEPLAATLLDQRQIPPRPWPWTDDTHMTISIVRVLREYGHIDQDALAQALAEQFTHDRGRGYGSGTAFLLEKIAKGEDWRKISTLQFSGGSYGNGAAMRAAPIGGFFGGDPARAEREAQQAAVVTHAHPEGQAGAMAVASAAAIAAAPDHPQGAAFIRAVLPFVPQTKTKEGIQLAAEIPAGNLADAMRLGTGIRISAQDTVPFCLWCAAFNLSSYEDALWQTVSGLGDCDTTCAIVGGIVALSARSVPERWIERREPLPADLRRAN